MSPVRWLAGALAAFVGLCCLGWAPALGLLAALGLGFLIDDRFLLPLLAVLVAIAVWPLLRPETAEDE
ncbi:MAG: hypothetical protein R3199_11465 [Gemmatimonadota bacterium]|nr:hypothetical protein [Gemmatimonadota bacterium]